MQLCLLLLIFIYLLLCLQIETGRDNPAFVNDPSTAGNHTLPVYRGHSDVWNWIFRCFAEFLSQFGDPAIKKNFKGKHLLAQTVVTKEDFNSQRVQCVGLRRQDGAPLQTEKDVCFG